MVKISNCKIVKCLIKLTRFQGMKQQCVENWSDCRGSKALKWLGNVESFGRRKGKCINALYPTLATALPRREMESSTFQRWEGRNRCRHYSLFHVRHICLFSWRLCFAVHSLLAEQTVQPPIEDKMSRTIPNNGTRGQVRVSPLAVTQWLLNWICEDKEVSLIELC